MNYNKKIPLEQDKIQLIIKSFEDGEFEYVESFKDHPTVTQNGRGAAIWNNIYTQIKKNFSVKGFKSGKISRGPWELVYVYDEATKYLYTFMREANFMNIHKGNMQDKLFHYTNVLSRLNGKLLGTYEPPYQQMSFIDTVVIDDNTDAKLEYILQEMINTIGEGIERYAIVLADCKKGQVQHIECVIPIAYMNPMYREDWTKYIMAEYATEYYDVDETMPEESEILLYDANADIDLSVRDEEEKKRNTK